MEVYCITDQNYQQEVEKWPGTVLLYVTATWCHPAVMGEAVLDDAVNWGPHLKVGKIDADTNPVWMTKLRANALPVIVIIHKGVIKEQKEGFFSAKELYQMVSRYN